MLALNWSKAAWTVEVVMLPELSTKRPTNSMVDEVIEPRLQRDVQSEAMAIFPLSLVTCSIIVRSIPSRLFTVSNSKPVGLMLIFRQAKYESVKPQLVKPQNEGHKGWDTYRRSMVLPCCKGTKRQKGRSGKSVRNSAHSAL